MAGLIAPHVLSLLDVGDLLNALASEILQVAEAAVVLEVANDGSQILLLRRPDRLVHHVDLLGHHLLLLHLLENMRLLDLRTPYQVVLGHEVVAGRRHPVHVSAVAPRDATRGALLLYKI